MDTVHAVPEPRPAEAGLTGAAGLAGAAGGLLRAAHPGPGLAVTLLGAAYAVSAGAGTGRVLLVAATLESGQLVVGWSNDLLDVRRDRAVGRSDKPLATGETSEPVVRAALAVAAAAAVVLSLACGWAAGLVHLALVAAALGYNLGLKATVLSWAPYAVAFGGLPTFVSLAASGDLPAWWVSLAGALLGVGAHLVNVLPDLADDEATGVRGLAHRVGPRPALLLAVGALGAATAVLVAGAMPATPYAVGVVVLVAALCLVALTGRGKVPFAAAVGIAALGVVLLVVAP